MANANRTDERGDLSSLAHFDFMKAVCKEFASEDDVLVAKKISERNLEILIEMNNQCASAAAQIKNRFIIRTNRCLTMWTRRSKHG